MSRLRGSAPVLIAILVVVALACGFSIATSAYVDQQATVGLRADLATRSGDDLALRASFDLADDPEQQDAAVRAAVARTFESTSVGFDVTRTLESGALFSTGATPVPASAMTVPDLESRADFDSGSVPDGPDQVAVQADAAAAFALQVGDEVEINGLPFEVSGTWRPLDALDPRWYGDETVATGGTDRSGPFVITEEAWARFDSAPTAVWTVVPTSFDAFTANNIEAVSAAWATIEQEWRGEVPEFDSMQVQRGLARTLDGFDRRVEGLRAVEPVAAVLVAGSALVVLGQLVQLLVAGREHETLLYWARGRSAAAIASRTALEVAGTAIVGAIVGAAAVAVGLAITVDSGQLLLLRPSAVAVPAVVVLGAIVIAALTSLRSTTSVTQSTKGGRGDGRARRIAVPGGVVLVTVAAAIAVWQLQLYGSPLTPNAEGSTSIDPIVVMAPAAALIAVVLAALVAFPSIVGLYARSTPRSGASIHLTTRSLARQTARIAAPLVIVALAVGAISVGATFSGTWSQLFTQSAALHAGADARISSPLARLTAAQRDAVAATENITAVAPVDVQSLSVGSITGTTVAATPDALQQVVSDADGIFSREEAADAIRVVEPGPVIPEGATSLTLQVEALDFDEPPALRAWIADSFGSVRPAVFDEPIVDEEADGALEYTTTLAEGSSLAPGTLLSFDVSFGNQSFGEPVPSFRIERLTAEVDGAAETLELGQYWVIDTLSDFTFPPSSTPAGDGFVLDSVLPSVRMTAALDGTERDNLRPGVVVTEKLASLLDLQIGDIIGFTPREVMTELNAEVTAIVQAIPGADGDVALLIDLAVINHLHQRVSREPAASTDLWVTTPQQQQVQQSVRSIVPANARVELSDDPVGRQVLGTASISLWAAALCCLLFALVAVAAASSSRLRWGRADFASLRAIGMNAREQSAVVVREFVVVLAVAVLAGAVAGLVVTLLTVPQFARAAVDRDNLPVTSLAVNWVGLGVLLGALAVGVAASMLILGRRVRSLASRLLPSEEQE